MSNPIQIYTFWYKRTVNADDLSDAIKREKKMRKMEFDSISYDGVVDIGVGADAIGFNVKR